jgi:hypothetical protein
MMTRSAAAIARDQAARGRRAGGGVEDDETGAGRLAGGQHLVESARLRQFGHDGALGGANEAPLRQPAMGVAVDQHHGREMAASEHAEIDRQCALAGSALLARDGEDAHRLGLKGCRTPLHSPLVTMPQTGKSVMQRNSEIDKPAYGHFIDRLLP